MTDDEIAALLRSDNPVVLIEAPAGCGKTYQAAEYAAHVAEMNLQKKVLVLTHTHAACSVVAERTFAIRDRAEVRTLDGFIHEIACAYRIALNLPEDVTKWVRAQRDGHGKLAEKVAELLLLNPMICRALAKRYPVIICDEHQDTNTHQERIVLAIAQHGSFLRIFGDPMQVIPGGHGQDAVVADVLARWERLKNEAAFGELEVPHRWKDSNPLLGDWILDARHRLKDGNAIDLSAPIPVGIDLLQADNNAYPGQSYRLSPAGGDWRAVNGVVNRDTSMLCVAGQSGTIDGLRSTFRNRLPIWEGHTRNDLEAFVDNVVDPGATLGAKAQQYVQLLKKMLSGFGTQYSDRFIQELQNPSANPRGQIPPQMRTMASNILEAPNHKGFSTATEHLRQLIEGGNRPFTDIRIDYPRELNDLIQLGRFEQADVGLAEIMQRRSRAHPKPPRKCLSTVHKSKGLEAHTVVVFACDGLHFPDRPAKRNLLYVALSRATHNLALVMSNQEPCVLFSH
jgi:DNA helicase-2/ATP-dependent DNA helicase PcrA